MLHLTILDLSGAPKSVRNNMASMVIFPLDYFSTASALFIDAAGPDETTLLRRKCCLGVQRGRNAIDHFLPNRNTLFTATEAVYLSTKEPSTVLLDESVELVWFDLAALPHRTNKVLDVPPKLLNDAE